MSQKLRLAILAIGAVTGHLQIVVKMLVVCYPMRRRLCLRVGASNLGHPKYFASSNIRFFFTHSSLYVL